MEDIKSKMRASKIKEKAPVGEVKTKMPRFKKPKWDGG